MAKAKKPAPKDRGDQFNVRLPEGLRDQITLVAERTGRSMNELIVASIIAQMDQLPAKGAGLHEVETFVHKLAIRMGQLEARIHALDGKGPVEGED